MKLQEYVKPYVSVKPDHNTESTMIYKIQLRIQSLTYNLSCLLQVHLGGRHQRPKSIAPFLTSNRSKICIGISPTLMPRPVGKKLSLNEIYSKI